MSETDPVKYLQDGKGGDVFLQSGRTSLKKYLVTGKTGPP